MEKLKKVFSPGHQKDEDVLYNDPASRTSTEGAQLGSSSQSTATPTQHSVGQPTSSVGQTTSSTAREPDLRRNVLDPETDIASRPNPSTHLSSASGVADDASVASIRSGVVGAGKSPNIDERTAGTGTFDHATGLRAQQTLPDRSTTPAGEPSSTARPISSRIPTMDPMSTHQHKGRGHNFKGDPCPPGDEPLAPGYPHHYKGPHGTDTANRLDPHVPGEFPSDDGFDVHDHGREGGLTSSPAAAATSAHAAQERGGALTGQEMRINEPGSTHHSGRDAALAAGAGAAGLGAYETHKHHNQTSEPNTLSQRSQPEAYDNASSAVVSPSTTERSFPLTSHPAGTTGTSTGATNTQPISRDVPSETSKDHHLGRDAALIGGAGAAGLAAHEAGSHRRSHELGRPEGYDDQRFDPTAASGDKPARIPNLIYGSSNKPTHTGQPESHHYGRDAAVAGGAGATAAAGTQLHGYNRAGPTETDPASKTVGPHKSNVLNVLDPRVLPQPEKQTEHVTSGPHKSDAMNTMDPRVDSNQSQQPQHHYGRDAAIAGGAGAAGVGAYEYGKHGHQAGPSQTDPASKTVGPHSSNVANVVDPRVQPEPEKMTDRTTTGPHNSDALNRADPRVQNEPAGRDEHHYGRDAALAGGAGAAGVGAYEYNKHRAGATQQDPASYTTGPHQSNAANIVDPRVQPEPEKMKDRTTAGPHNSDTMNRADPRVDSDLSRQNRDHHYGRDAALAGGAGAAGVGAYEYGKQHHGGPIDNNPASTTAGPHPTNTANVIDPRVQANPTSTSRADPSLSQQNKDHHYGRDAALVGGAGTAGVGAYEYGKHHNAPSDNLGSSNFDPRSTNTSNVVDPTVQPSALSGNQAGTHADPSLSQKSKDHHYGRDAAVTGGVGAAGAGAYEYGKHHNAPDNSNLGSSTFDPRSTNTSNVVDPSTDPTLAQQGKGHHYGRDAAVAGGAGAAGYGAYEAIDAKEQEKLAKQQAKEAEKAQKAQEKATEKELKHQQKEREHEIAKQEKAAQKEREHEEKKAAAAAAAAHEKEEKKHQHQLDKEEKQRQHQLEKQEKEREKAEKEAEKENEKGEKKHHLFGFLHRDKSKEPEEELRQQGSLEEADRAAHERHQRELEAGAASGTVGAAGAKFEPTLQEQQQHPLASAPQYVSIDDNGHQHVSTDPQGRHRLHKDPPAKVLREHGIDPERQSYDSSRT